MEAIDGLLHGLSVVVTPGNLLAAFLGVFVGTLIGVLPGIGPVGGAAIVLPLTFTLEPVTGVIVIAAIYYGAQYGGSTTSILMNMPGEASSIITAIDGYEMTRKGRAGAALTIVALGSFVAGISAMIALVFLSPFVSRLGLAFGPPEFFALTAGGLLLLTRISGGSWGSNLLPMGLGLLIGTVGLEPVTGVNRFTFGVPSLTLGFSIVTVAVGLFGIAELARLAADSQRRAESMSIPFRELVPTRTELGRAWAPWGRGTVIGFIMGLLPGPSATMSSFLSYRAEQRLSKYRHELGKGAVEGVAGPEAANNSAATSSVLPVLALGIPFSATLALILAALAVQGITPGPLLMVQHPDIYWGLLASLLIGNLMLVVLNVPMVGVWVSVLRIPTWVLIPVIVVLATIGAYTVHNNVLDLWLLLVFGVIGYVFTLFGFKLAPLVIGIILGPLMEKYLMEGLYASAGRWTYFIESPIVQAIWAVVIIGMCWGLVGAWLRRRRAVKVKAKAKGVGLAEVLEQESEW